MAHIAWYSEKMEIIIEEGEKQLLFRGPEYKYVIWCSYSYDQNKKKFNGF